MNHIRGCTNKTAVKVLIKLSTLVFLCSGLTANAAETASPAAVVNPFALAPNQDPCILAANEKDEKARANYEKLCANREGGNSCKDQLGPAQEALKEIKSACVEGNLGGEGNCFDRAIICAKVSRTDIVDVQDQDGTSTMVDSLLSGLGISQGLVSSRGGKNNLSKEQRECPQYSSENYNKRKKDLNDEKKKLQEDIAKKQKEVVEDQKKAEEDVAKITKDIQKAQKEMQKDNADADKELRDSLNSHKSNMNEVKDQLAEANAELVKKRGQLARLRIDISKQLSLLNNKSAKARCAEEANKVYQANSASFQNSASFSSRREKKTSAIQVYKVCMEQMDIERQGLIEASRQSRQDKLLEIENAEDKIARMQTSMDEAGKALLEIEKAAKDSKDQRAKALLEEMKSATNEMQSIQANLQKKQMITTAETNKMNEQLNSIDNELNNLGTPPPEDSKIGSSTAARKVAVNMETVVSYVNSCCIDKSQCNTAMQSVAQKYKSAGGDIALDKAVSGKSTKSRSTRPKSSGEAAGQ